MYFTLVLTSPRPLTLIQLVDLKDSLNPITDQEMKLRDTTYEQLWHDMRMCVDRCHKDGVIKNTVAKDPSKYIQFDPNLFPMLAAFKQAGRKVL